MRPGSARPRAGRLAALLAAALWLAACSGPEQKPKPGFPAPDFTLTALDGTRVRLGDLAGKVVFVNLWATWCPPCRDELPSMVAFYERFKDRGVEILAVSEDTDPEAVRKMVRRLGVTFPVLMDERKRVYNLYQATGVPETHLIDRDGVIRASRIGPFDWTSPDVIRTVESLLP